MPANLDNLGYGSQWTDFCIDHYEGYQPNMSDYHMHGYYEVSLILSGEVKVLLPNSVVSGTESRLVLTRPMTSHLIVCEPSMLYKRINLLFSKEFVTDCVPEWKQLLNVFGKNGRVIPLSVEQQKELLSLVEAMKSEKSSFRQRLWLMLFLSKVLDQLPDGTEDTEELPPYVAKALTYLQENYAQKIVASELAWSLQIGRTTLMTAFKHYTGRTLNEYLTGCRLNHAIKALRKGETQLSVAQACGFGDPCNLIRAFRQRFGMTPGQYLKSNPPHVGSADESSQGLSSTVKSISSPGLIRQS